MVDVGNAEALARTWIEMWQAGTPDDIPLAENFVHTSPFGRLEGRDFYLETIKPASKANVADLIVVKTLGSGSEAVIQFEMHTAAGMIPCCDWVTVDGDQILSVHSFYDATMLRMNQI